MCPWPLYTGDKHEKHPRIFVPLAILSLSSQASLCEGGGLLQCQQFVKIKNQNIFFFLIFL
jgi:hypothetical protein